MLLPCILLLSLLWQSALSLLFFPKTDVRPLGVDSDTLLIEPSERHQGRAKAEYINVSYVTMPKTLPTIGRGESISFAPPPSRGGQWIGALPPQEMKCIVEDVYDHSETRVRTMHGHVSSLLEPEGDCTIVCGILNDDGLVSCIGNIRPLYLVGSQYELRPLLNGTFHILKEVPFNDYEEDAEMEKGTRRQLLRMQQQRSLRQEEEGLLESNKRRQLTDTNEIMDIMIVYTPAAKEYSGSAAALAMHAQFGIDESNKILERSKINLRLRLVYITEMSNTAYTDPSDLSTILYEATYTTGSYTEFNTEQTLRYSKGADALVILAGDSSSCGIAWLNGQGSASSQISVTAVDCFVGYYSFVHELGHNLGATHDASVSDHGDGEYYYSHGWCWDRAAATSCDGTCRRSVMAYSSCETETLSPTVCSSCPRVGYFSNPDVSESGTPTGKSGEADNTLSINTDAAHAVGLVDSLQSGGLVFSVEPNAVPSSSSCFEVVITGWHIGGGNDITSVSLAGVTVVSVQSQTRDSVVVLADSGPVGGAQGDVVIYRSDGGDVTTLEKGFNYLASDSPYVLTEDFEGEIQKFDAVEELSFLFLQSSCSGGGLCESRGGSTGSGVYASTRIDGTGRSAGFSANFSSGDCVDTVSYISVDYFAHSAYSFCYNTGFLTIQVRYSANGPWVAVATATSVQPTDTSPWYTLSTSSFSPSVLYGIRVLVSTYHPTTNCDYFNPVSLDNINVTYTTSCGQCPAAPSQVPSSVPSTAAPTGSPSSSPSTAYPTRSPTSVPSTTSPSQIPTSLPSVEGATHNPSSASSTATPSAAPTSASSTATPSSAPTSVPSTAAPSEVPSSVPSTAAPTSSPSVFVSRTRASFEGGIIIVSLPSDACSNSSFIDAFKGSVIRSSGGRLTSAMITVVNCTRIIITPNARLLTTVEGLDIDFVCTIEDTDRDVAIETISSIQEELEESVMSKNFSMILTDLSRAHNYIQPDAEIDVDEESFYSSSIEVVTSTASPTFSPTFSPNESRPQWFDNLIFIVGLAAAGFVLFIALPLICACAHSSRKSRSAVHDTSAESNSPSIVAYQNICESAVQEFDEANSAASV